MRILDFLNYLTARAIFSVVLLAIAGCGRHMFTSTGPVPPIRVTNDATRVTPSDETAPSSSTPTSSTSAPWVEIQEPEWPRYAAWSPDSQSIVFVSSYENAGWLTLYDVAARQVIWQNKNATPSPVFSPDGEFVVGSDYRIPYIDVTSGNLRQTSSLVGGTEVIRTAFLPDGSALIVGTTYIYSDDTAIGDIGIWDEDHKRLNVTLHLDSFINSLILSPKGDMLAAGLWNVPNTEDGHQVFLWDYPSMVERCKLEGDKALFDPSGKTIATSGTDDGIMFFDIATCEHIVSFPADAYPGVFSFSPDGEILAYAANPCCAIDLVDIKTGEIDHRYSIPGGDVNLLAYSPNGEYLLAIVGEYSNLQDAYVESLLIWTIRK